MKSGFVQLIVKNRLANKAIDRAPYSPRYQPVDSFQKFITQTLPKMQQSIQIQLLKKNLAKIQSPSVRKQLIQSYTRRLFRLRSYQKDQIQSYRQLQDIEQQPVLSLPDPTIFKHINEHTAYDIGNYIVFSNDDFKKVFKHGSFGRYAIGQYSQYRATDKFGVQIRKDALGITNVMKIIQQNKDRDAKKQWALLDKLSENEEDLVEYINDEKNYPLLFNDLSNHIYSITSKLTNQETYSRVWRSSMVSDVICHSVLQNITLIKQDPFKLVQKLVQQINQMQIAPSPGDIAKRFRQLPTVNKLKLKTFTEPMYFAKFHYQTPSFKNVFLGGNAGNGKSMILTYVSMWAYKNNWIVINVPSAYKWTNDRQVKHQRGYNGLYMIKEHAVQWLDQFKNANKQLLETIEFKKQLYGLCDITGTHQNQYEPVPNLWDQRRKVHFDEVQKKFNIRQDVETKLRQEKQAAMRMTDVLPNPKSISQLIEAGLSNPQYSICAMAEVLQQVYSSDKLICEIVDDFSHFYRPSWYRSYKYFNDRGLYGHIPPYHLAHCRLFMHLDGHKLKNGFKVVASSNYPYYKHKFDIKQLMFPQNYEHKVPNMTVDQFQKAGRFNILSNYWPADEIQKSNMGYVYTISQGNWGDFVNTIRSGHYY